VQNEEPEIISCFQPSGDSKAAGTEATNLHKFDHNIDSVDNTGGTARHLPVAKVAESHSSQGRSLSAVPAVSCSLGHNTQHEGIQQTSGSLQQDYQVAYCNCFCYYTRGDEYAFHLSPSDHGVYSALGLSTLYHGCAHPVLLAGWIG